ncbi:hypothetical protein UlMin_003946 [Ulmus minor]
MAKEASNRNNVATKPSSSPSPLRNSKFFQANMRILVTGGAGFIGSHLVDKLMENEKNEVIVADNYFIGSKDNLNKWIGHPRFELICHDFTETLLVEVDQIYHLACLASPIFYKYNPIKTIKTNVIGTLNMLGLAKRVVARILLTSTSEVYGDPLMHPQDESYWGNVNPIGVRSCYDEGKRVAETLIFDYHRQHGIEGCLSTYFVYDLQIVSNLILLSKVPNAFEPKVRSFSFVFDNIYIPKKEKRKMEKENNVGIEEAIYLCTMVEVDSTTPGATQPTEPFLLPCPPVSAPVDDPTNEKSNSTFSDGSDLYEGQYFSNKQELKNKLTEIALKGNFEFWTRKSNSWMWVIECVDPSCS